MSTRKHRKGIDVVCGVKTSSEQARVGSGTRSQGSHYEIREDVVKHQMIWYDPSREERQPVAYRHALA